MTHTKDTALNLALKALELSAVTVDSFGVQKKTQEAITAIKQALAAPVQPVQDPVAFEVSLVEWVGNKLMATPKVTTTPPASWMEMVTANLVREGVNKHKARELAEHFYSIAAPVPDAITDNSESVEYRAGWNDCRELTIQLTSSPP